MIKICLVGTGGMVPLHNRYLSSLLISCEGSMILVDCGEGTQMSLKNIGWGLKAIDIICISHFHGDHIFGLPGLLSTIENSGRTEPLTIIGPSYLERILNNLCTLVNISYNINIVEVPENSPLNFKYKNYTINSAWLEHHVPCLGFSFTLNRSPKFDKEKALANKVPMKLWNVLQKSKEVIFENKLYTNTMVLGNERRGIKISYCTDTRPTDNIVKLINNSNLFVCEGMYGDNDLLEKARSKKHMIFAEAANLAKLGNVEELWLTHYSPSLVSPEGYIDSAKAIFPNTTCGYDGLWKELSFNE